jgi:CheY-like chemotaxis protein
MKPFNKIVLVDDDKISNTIASLLFKQMSLAEEVVVLSNGQEALDYVEQFLIPEHLQKSSKSFLNKPDLILLDICMPLIDGFEFLEAFNKMESIFNTQIAHIVMLTCSKYQQDIEKALAFNVAGYIEKPLTREKMENIIELLHFKQL